MNQKELKAVKRLYDHMPEIVIEALKVMQKRFFGAWNVPDLILQNNTLKKYHNDVEALSVDTYYDFSRDMVSAINIFSEGYVETAEDHRIRAV